MARGYHKPERCDAELDGRGACVLDRGMAGHELREVADGQLRLPVLVHQLSDGARWTVKDGLLWGVRR